MKAEDDKIKKENRRLRKEMAKLRRDNSKIKKMQRQNDQNNTLELQHLLKDSIRQRDFSSELKKMMKKEIDEYLQGDSNCLFQISLVEVVQGVQKIGRYTATLIVIW